MKKIFVSTLSALLLMIVLTTTALAAPAAEKEHVRFKGSLQSVEIGNAVDFPIVHVTATGSGKGTQLGRFTYSYTVDIHVNPADGSAVGTLYYTFVAANGDRLYSTGYGRSNGIPVPGTLFNQVVETHTITGGTGRFAGATGNFTVDRLVGGPDPALKSSSGTFDGYIVLAED